jgi:hypothetical protein
VVTRRHVFRIAPPSQGNKELKASTGFATGLSAVMLLLTAVLPSAAQTASSNNSKTVPKAEVHPNPAVLLKAINFVLTGTDAPAYQWDDIDNCQVIWETNKGDDENHSIVVFYFNNIDASRVTLNHYQLRYTDHVEYL